MSMCALSAGAQEKPKTPPQDPHPWRDVELRAGLFSGSFRSGLETTNDLGTGFSINLEDTLDKVSAKDLLVYVDVSALEKGEHTLPLQFKLPNEILLNHEPPTIKVRIK